MESLFFDFLSRTGVTRMKDSDGHVYFVIKADGLVKIVTQLFKHVHVLDCSEKFEVGHEFTDADKITEHTVFENGVMVKFVNNDDLITVDVSGSRGGKVGTMAFAKYNSKGNLVESWRHSYGEVFKPDAEGNMVHSMLRNLMTNKQFAWDKMEISAGAVATDLTDYDEIAGADGKAPVVPDWFEFRKEAAGKRSADAAGAAQPVKVSDILKRFRKHAPGEESSDDSDGSSGDGDDNDSASEESQEDSSEDEDDDEDEGEDNKLKDEGDGESDLESESNEDEDEDDDDDEDSDSDSDDDDDE
jgi:hypothetical protein